MYTVNAVCLKLPLQKCYMHHQKSVCDNAHLTTLISIGFSINNFSLICNTPNGIHYHFNLHLSHSLSMAPHSSTLAWKIPWTEEPGGLQFMGSRRVGHDWATSLSLFTFMHWRRKWQPTPVFLPGEFQGRRSLLGCRLWGHRVGYEWSDLAAAAWFVWLDHLFLFVNGYISSYTLSVYICLHIFYESPAWHWDQLCYRSSLLLILSCH